MFLLVDIEDLIQAYPERKPAATPEHWDKVPQLQLLEIDPEARFPNSRRDRAHPHPVVVAGTLTDLAAGGDIPPAGRNIPETGQ